MTVVTFFATWCVPCRTEQPELVRFESSDGRSNPVEVVSVIYQDEPGAVRQFERSHGGSWPVVADPSGSIAAAYEVIAVPRAFVVNPEGKVVQAILGGVTARSLKRIIATHPLRKALDGPSTSGLSASGP